MRNDDCDGLGSASAQITAEWLDTETGEVSRGRIVPADRAGVRKFLARFAGRELEAALEATTGWRFVVEELRAVGAGVHLAEPAETSALRGNKQRAKNDRADARHLRELLMAGRLPECWIAPGHLLDLRARVRLRHTLVDERGECQQRMQAVLYHHGLPKRGTCSPARAARGWRSSRCRLRRREQITVALGMIDAVQVADRSAGSGAALLRAPPGRLSGGEGAIRDRCADERRDPRRARRHPPVLLLQRGGPLRRSGYHRSCSPTSGARQGTSPGKARRRCAGRSTKPRRPPAGPGQPDCAYYQQAADAARREPRVPGARAQAAQTELSHPARARRRGARARMRTTPVRAMP